MALLLDLVLRFLTFLFSDRCQYILCSKHVAPVAGLRRSWPGL